MRVDLFNAYRKSEDYFFKNIALESLDLGHGVCAYKTGVPLADLNLVYITKKPPELESILRQSELFFRQDGLSFVVIIPQEFNTAAAKAIFTAMGYQSNGASTSMALDLAAFTGSTELEGSEISIKDTNNALTDWGISLEAFEGPSAATSSYLAAHQRARDKKSKIYHFTLYKQTQPISSITLSLIDNFARADDVATLPMFQGQGYATHLMCYALSEAKRRGARHCFLEASSAGLRLYEKLGFKPLFENALYSAQA